MEKDVKIIGIEKRESFIKIELEYEGEEYRGLLLKYGNGNGDGNVDGIFKKSEE